MARYYSKIEPSTLISAYVVSRPMAHHILNGLRYLRDTTRDNLGVVRFSAQFKIAASDPFQVTMLEINIQLFARGVRPFKIIIIYI